VRIGDRLLPTDFPVARLVTPKLVSFRASDGVEAHGQLFEPAGGGARKPARSCTSTEVALDRCCSAGTIDGNTENDYGANQYLASRGFIVLSVDYRLSVGYGQAFQFGRRTPGHAAQPNIATSLRRGSYLQTRAQVDPSRIGVWGASLGGYLTALALGRNSDVFAAGVDIHGVHTTASRRSTGSCRHAPLPVTVSLGAM